MSNTNDISQIRNLIFGETIKGFDERFEKLDNEISNINNKLDQFLAQLSGEKSDRQNDSKQIDDSLKGVNSQIVDLKNDLLNKLNSLEASKAANMDLAKIFSEVSDRLRNDDQK